MKSLPILLKNPKILLIGGGEVAFHKATVLMDNEIDFEIISQEYIDKFKDIKALKRVKKFDINHIQDFSIIVDATGNNSVKEALLKEKKNKNFLLNIVDEPNVCDFYFSSLLKYGKLKIAISSDGSSPTATQVLRDEIKKIVPNGIEEFCNNQAKKRKEGIINKEQSKLTCKGLFTQVYLIGCGLGDADLLTIKAYKAMQKVDVVLYDHLITQEILDLVPNKTKRVFVGKQKGNHNKTQEEINELILKYTKQGLIVARLKSGDPFIFGRGAEEAQYLMQEGYKVEAINGISSCIAGPSMANIPVTARGYATNFSVVSAHLKGSLINLDWCDLLHIKNHTTVVLMGLSLCSHIQKKALSKGVSKNLKVAIISNASRENQKTKITTLENLHHDSLEMQSPAILVFGNVVDFHNILN